jgi:predicted TIM-barrel fold metal-dependent hydrolase
MTTSSPTLTKLDSLVLDSDTHVVEPPDLWSKRLPANLRDSGPAVQWDEARGLEAWYLDGEFLMPVGAPASAGWHEHAPLFPRRWTDVAPHMYDPAKRLERMDADGIYAQVLYPNVAHFNSSSISHHEGAGLRSALMYAYNDYLTEFISAAPNRFIAITSIPFWDIEASIAEVKRCRDLGHSGIIMTQDPRRFALPGLGSKHWDPLWAALQDLDLSVNFHIGSNGVEDLLQVDPEGGIHANAVLGGVGLFMGNATTISTLICGGVCHRFPKLKFVAVESGVGWIPFHLDILDWQWMNCGVAKEHPEYELLPSEYFQRQIYSSFWFERSTLKFAIERLGTSNILFETDFPHQTCMFPGPASVAVAPQQYIEETLGDVSAETRHKLLWKNAADLYHIEYPAGL